MTALPETLTLKEAPAVMASLRTAFAGESAPEWRLDAAALRHVDSSAVAVLLECKRMAASAGRRVVVDGAPPRLLELATLYGVEELIAAA